MGLIEEAPIQQVETFKVLVADDDPPTRILLRAAISQWGYEVIEAKDGEEAWEILQQADAPRLIILDWLMPRLDGIALCARIKAELKHHPYTILLTQVTGTTNIVKGLEAGADEFLSKPFNMAELRSRLSVGARIVKFEIDLAEQNKRLQTHVMQIEKLSHLISDYSKKMDTFSQLQAITKLSQEDHSCEQQLQELQTHLEEIKNNCKTK